MKIITRFMVFFLTVSGGSASIFASKQSASTSSLSPQRDNTDYGDVIIFQESPTPYPTISPAPTSNSTSSPAPTYSSAVPTASPAPSLPQTPMPSVSPAPTPRPTRDATPTAAPTTAKPTDPPSTPSPTSSPTPAPHDDKKKDHKKNRPSLLRILGKTIAWLFILALALLCFGFLMSNRYRIYYYLKSAYYAALRWRGTQWFLRKTGLGRLLGLENPQDSLLNEVIFEYDQMEEEGLLLQNS